MNDEEESFWRSFSIKHSLNDKIKDTDVFLHGTSLKNYLAIQSKGFMLRKAPKRNYSISDVGIYFEKYVKQNVHNVYVVIPTIIDCCEAACEKDQNSEGVILQIQGRELKKLGCPIYVDWNKPFARIKDSEGISIDVDINTQNKLLSIIIVDCDIPFKYLKVVKRIPFKQLGTYLSPVEIKNFFS